VETSVTKLSPDPRK